MKDNKEKMITKVIRFKIIKPICPIDDWVELKKIVKKLQEEVRLASNRSITYCNLYHHEELIYGKTQAEKTWKEIYDKNLRNYLYEICTTNCPSLGTKSAGSIGEEIISKYFKGNNSYVKTMEKGEGNPPMSFKKDIAIPITAQGTKIEKNNKGYYNLTIPMVSNNFKKNWNSEHDVQIKNGQFTFAIEVKYNNQKTILDNCINGIYKIGGSKLLTVKDKENKNILCFNLTYSFVPNKNIILDQNKVCGVDLGINVPAFAAVNYNTYSRYKIYDSTIIQQKIKLKHMTKQLQRNLKYGTIGDSGHGTKTKVESLIKAKNRISNLTDTKNSQWAKDIVDWAEKMNCGKLQMEDLSGFNAKYSKDNFLKHWTYYDLQQKIENKCKEKGIVVEKINPKYTSQKCSECGYISPENRPKETKGQAYFKCCKCGHEENADFNAAKNIAREVKEARITK